MKHLVLRQFKWLVAVLLTAVFVPAEAQERTTFTAETVEGIPMSFVVVSEEDKTCEVGVGESDKGKGGGKGEGGVIPSGIEGPLTIPGEANGYRVIGIAPYAFMGVEDLSGITALNMPDCLEYIGGNACSFMTGLTVLRFPPALKTIEGQAFEGCVNVGAIKVSSDNTTLDSRGNCNAVIVTADNALILGCKNTVIPEDVVELTNVAFMTMGLQGKIVVPASVKIIDNNVFAYNPDLTEVVLYEGLEKILHQAFMSCGLKSVTLPSILIGLDTKAFWYNPLEKVTSLMTQPFAIYDDTFEPSYGQAPTATLYVPEGKVEVYKKKNGWKRFPIITTTIANGVYLDKSKAIVEKSKTMTLKATVYPETLVDKSVKWKSSNTTVATVTSSGKVKGVKAGTATITCTSVATGAKATCQVTVSYVKLDKTEAILEKGKTMTLTSTVYPSKQTDQSVTWKSSNTAVATVTSSGKVKGVKAGIATITCTSVATGLSTTCKVTVSYVKLDKSKAILEKGKTMTLASTVYPSKQTDQSVTWKSSNTEVATVTSSGKVKGVKAGIATITCTSVATGLSTTCKVTVSYVKLNISEVTIDKGNTITLTPTVYPSKQTDQSVTWKSSDKTVATVTSSGKVTGIKAGTATITCTSVATGLSTTCKVTVTASSARTLDEEDADVTGIENLNENPAVEEPFNVYDLRGRKVMQRVTSLDGLPAGVYIVNGKKVLKK